MNEQAAGGRGWARSGCLIVAGLALIVVLAGVAASVIAVRQNRSGTTEALHLEQPSAPTGPPLPREAGERESERPIDRVVLEVAVGQATVVPGPPGSPISVDGVFDPRRFRLSNQSTEDADGRRTTRIALLPLGSEAWELFRLKVGGAAPRVRVALPRGMPLELQGSIRKGLLALELGGLSVRAADLDVQGGSVELSFIEPTSRPMERLSVQVSGGAMEVGQLGNASPRRSSLVQHFGALDLDLRGPWQRDAEVYVEGRTAGGSVWLPDNVRIEGVERPAIGARPPPEIAPPTLRLTVDARKNQVLLID